MIPSINERINHDCCYCVFGYENIAGDIVCKITDALKRQVSEESCIYNYTVNEMKKLIENLDR